MGLFGKIIKNAVGEGVSKAVEKAVSPAAEKLVNKVAEQINTATDFIENAKTVQADNDCNNGNSNGGSNDCSNDGKCTANLEAAVKRYSDAVGSIAWNQVLAAYPKWDLSPIKDTATDDEDEYMIYTIYIDANEDMVNAYLDTLRANGFNGDFQIMRKLVDGVEHIVDFSFVYDGDDSAIRYLIRK